MRGLCWFQHSRPKRLFEIELKELVWAPCCRIHHWVLVIFRSLVKKTMPKKIAAKIGNFEILGCIIYHWNYMPPNS